MTSTAPVSLAARQPAASVITECLRAQSNATPRSAGARLFGRTPLSADSEPWYLGALGELEVARRLDALGPDWRVFHSVPIGRGSSDIDHVVIGPPGVFTINAKHHEGRDIWLGAKRLLVSGQRTDHLRNAGFEAKRASQRLSVAVRALVDVTPIIAIVGARKIIVRERPTTVVVLRERELVKWLGSRPATVPPGEIERLADAAARPSTWHEAPTLDVADVAAFERLRREVDGARGRRRWWAVGGLLAMFAALPIAAVAAWTSVMSALMP
ncbi:NERD domain-containing protein [Agromyces endophyticus]|uniref:nuclease-related domain-containing protein n=1 Tax=Agromyces sp. H17E-10 TaxID=2932244 RepID=UPI001FD08310|nr:nuclease-related domain-containing protein [Agromyces sp. H17E-10]UOQ88031.1 NERD domain-containing protein [Agromyces sp. H17E-10]